jgi:hypothetical protein
MAHGMTAVRQDPFARLDAWVLEELEALSGPRTRQAERPRRRAEAEPEAARFDEAALDEGPLPVDENQFIQRVTEWLQGRPNADLILEEIWRNVVSPEDLGDDPGEDAADETALSADVEGTHDLGDELPAEDEPPEGPADAADEAPLPPQG